MEKKILLTQEQADVIEELKKRGIQDFLHYIGVFSLQGRFKNLQTKCLNNLSVEELSICLLVSDSYEVIPKFSVGDWIRHDEGEVGKITKIEELSGQVQIFTDIADIKCMYSWEEKYIRDPERFFRHATPEEIQQEKKRRFWEKLGREVNEYKQGDIVTTGFGNYTSITKLEMNKKSVYFDGPEAERSFDEIYLVAPEEQRMDK